MLKRIEFEPGINRESTQYASSGGWYDSGNIRFRGGFPETIGGWERDSDYSLDGIIRRMFSWTDYNSSKLFAVGTDWKMYIVSGGVPTNVTPIGKNTVSLASENFSTLNDPPGSAGETVTGNFIQVDDSGHGVLLNDFVTFSDMDGIDSDWDCSVISVREKLNDQEKQVAYVLDDDKYWIAIPETVVDDTVAVSFSADLAYQINIGLSVRAEGTGWGSSVFGGVAVVSDTFTDITTGATTLITATNSLSNGDLVLVSGVVDSVGTDTVTGTLANGSAVVTGIADTSGISGGMSVSGTGIVAGTTVDSKNSTTVTLDTAVTANGVYSLTFSGNLAVVINNKYFTVSAATSSQFVIDLISTGLDAWASGGTATGGEGWGDSSTISVLTGDLRHVFIDNYNEDLMFLNSGGPLYYWDTSENSARGIPIEGDVHRFVELKDFSGSSNPPDNCNSFMVSDRDGHVIALGCNDILASGLNNLLVRWSDQNNPFDWTPSADNTSGGQMLRIGSKIIGAVNTKSEILLFTDGGVYSMRFVGPPDTFSFSIVSEGVELMTGASAIDVANVVYFMGSDKFYMYTGAVSPLACPLQKQVFGDFNKDARSKVFAGLNHDFSEILWFYPTADSWEPNMYVAFNYAEQTWYSGTFDMKSIANQSAASDTNNRTAWLDSRTRNEALSGYIEDYDPDSMPEVKKSGVMIQEKGRTAKGSPLECFIESGLFGISEGDNISYVSRIIPDFQFFGFGENPTDPTITATIKGNNFPGNATSTLATTTIEYSTADGTTSPVGNSTGIRARAREMAIRFESSGNSSGWRLGATRLDIKPDGRR